MMNGDGKELVRGQVGMDHKVCGNWQGLMQKMRERVGMDGTRIPSPRSRRLLQRRERPNVTEPRLPTTPPTTID